MRSPFGSELRGGLWEARDSSATIRVHRIQIVPPCQFAHAAARAPHTLWARGGLTRRPNPGKPSSE